MEASGAAFFFDQPRPKSVRRGVEEREEERMGTAEG
jgi:hypothetical protein